MPHRRRRGVSALSKRGAFCLAGQRCYLSCSRQPLGLCRPEPEADIKSLFPANVRPFATFYDLNQSFHCKDLTKIRSVGKLPDATALKLSSSAHAS